LTPERWAQIEELFHRAAECDPQQRSSLLDEACGSDVQLRAEVEALLSSDGSAVGCVSGAVRSELHAFEFPLKGATVSHYRILDGLGGGGMGLVYRAEDIRLGRRVALKFLPEESAKDPVALGRFEREARSASALEHPNICPIYELGEHEGQPFLVMQLLEGQTLRDLISAGNSRRPPLALDKLLDLAIQIADGLGAAHQHGIVHRDIKPANIFVTSQGQAKILDFGLAKLAADASGAGGDAESHPAGTPRDTVALTAPKTFFSRTGMAMGTAGYMSPEQVRGEKLDARTDLFSFGLVLYEMATGKHAFKGDTGSLLQEAILEQKPGPVREVNPKLPPKLEKIISRALEKGREARYQTAAEMRADLERLKKRPNRWRVLAAAAISAAVLLAAGIFVARRRATISNPSFERLTFDRGSVYNARFTPDGNTIVYDAAWGGKPSQIFSTLPGTRTSSPLGPPNMGVLAISSKGQVAALVKPYFRQGGGARAGALALLPMSGGAPREVLQDVGGADFSPDGQTLAVVHWVPDGIRCRLEFPIGHVLYEADYKSPSFISDPRISPHGDRVVFLEHPIEGDTVAVVDLAGRKTTLTQEWSSTSGLAWSHDGKELFFYGERAGEKGIYAVDLSGNLRLLLRQPEPTIVEDVSPQGRVLAIRQTTRGECWVHLPGDTAEQDFTWLASSQCMSLSADGSTVVMQVGEGGTAPSDTPLFVRRDDAASPVQIGDGFALALSPDGRWALSLDGSIPPKLAVLPTGPGEPRTLPRGRIERYDPVAGGWLPDNRQVVFVGREKGHDLRAYVQNIDGGEPRAITPEKPFAGNPPGLVVSADGKLVIFTTGNEEGFFAYPIEGGQARALTGLERGDFPIAWSPDGGSLFVNRSGVTPEVRVVNLRTGERRLWKTFMPPDPAGVDVVYPVLTRDGRFYSYSYDRTLAELYLVDGVR
jgi:serine/threonine protein kinase/Tol biopolymer transport system component